MLDVNESEEDLPKKLPLGIKLSGVAPRFFRRGADSSDEGARIWFSGS